MSILGLNNLSHNSAFDIIINSKNYVSFDDNSLKIGSKLDRIFAGETSRYLSIENVSSDTSLLSGISITRNTDSSSNSAAVINFLRTRGTTDNSTTAIQSGDTLGILSFHGTNGDDIGALSARIRARGQIGNVSTTIAASLEFQTRSRGNDLDTRLSISDNGGVSIGSTFTGDGNGNDSKLTIFETSTAPAALIIRHGAINQQTSAIRFSRTDNNVRWHDIVAQSSATRADNYIAFNVHNTTTATSQTRCLTLTGDQNVGVARNDAAYTLDVQSGAVEIARFFRNGGNAALRLQSSGGACLFGASGSGEFVVSNVENMTANPYILVNFAGSGSFSVGDNRITTSIGSTRGFTVIAGGTPRIHSVVEADLPHFFCNITTGVIMRFRTGTTNVGSISVTASNTAFNTSSDYRLKKNIIDCPEASTILNNIKVRSFDWKSNDSHQRYGVVAQEVDLIYPEAITKGNKEDPMWSVDYSKFVPLLIKEIQDLRTRILEIEKK
jgi:hypothetical protein